MRGKYFLIVLFLILAMFLSGCGGSGIVTAATETEEEDFQEVVNLLDTPEKLIEYMSRNFKHYVEDMANLRASTILTCRRIFSTFK